MEDRSEVEQRQEIFNLVIRMLVKQGQRSIRSTGECAYRGTNGRKCAVGLLISDEEYTPKMEGQAVYSAPMIKELLPKRLVPHACFLRELQRKHDLDTTWRNRETFIAAFKKIAENYRFNANVLTDIPDDFLKDA